MALETLLSRIEEKQHVRGPDQCWPWLGHIDGDGNPRIWVDQKLGSVVVPRAIFMAKGKHIPDGMEVLSCPILKDCTNERHFGLATRDEVADRILWRKGLERRPERSSVRRALSDEQVRQIYLSTDQTSVLAKRYNTTEGQIANIRHGRRHQRITAPLQRQREAEGQGSTVPHTV